MQKRSKPDLLLAKSQTCQMTRVESGFWLLLAATIALLLLSVPAAAIPTKPAAIFVLGDSYADTGNSNETSPVQNYNWEYPYGMTWPGHPTGRYSNGKVSTDYLAELIRLPRPRAYQSIGRRSNPGGFRQGINFAVGGAGVFRYNDTLSISHQVSQLKRVVRQHRNLFDLPRSLVFLFVSGNDYLHRKAKDPSATQAESSAFVDRVVARIGDNVVALHHLGFRYFALGNLQPIECLPIFNPQGYTTCNQTVRQLSSYHNQQLLNTIAQLRTGLPGSEIVELDLHKAFSYVIQYPRWFGIKHPLGSCCQPVNQSYSCGEYDANNQPLFTVCANPEEWSFWDSFHPTSSCWGSATALLFSGFNVTDPTPNLLYWLNTLDLGAPPPRSSFTRAEYIALASTLLETVNRTGDYPQLWRLEQDNSATIAALVYKNSNQLPPGMLDRLWPVTVFLPTEAAVQRDLGTEFLLGTQFLTVATEIALQHVVYGAWPLSRLTASHGQWLETLAGYSLQVVVRHGVVYLSSGTGRGLVLLARPDVFVAPGVGVVHQTASLLLPPRLYFP